MFLQRARPALCPRGPSFRLSVAPTLFPRTRLSRKFAHQADDSDPSDKRRTAQRAYYAANKEAILSKARQQRLEKKIERQELEDDYGIQDVLRFALSHKFSDLAVYDTSSTSVFTDYVVVLTAPSVRSLRMLAHKCYKEARALGACKQNPDSLFLEDRGSDEWIVLHLGDIWIHFFVREGRERHSILESNLAAQRIPTRNLHALRNRRSDDDVSVVDNMPEGEIHVPVNLDRDDLGDSDDEGSACRPQFAVPEGREAFIPTKKWKTVHDRHVLPPGLQVGQFIEMRENTITSHYHTHTHTHTHNTHTRLEFCRFE
jgi:ribosomal silencing factor RsfS